MKQRRTYSEATLEKRRAYDRARQGKRRDYTKNAVKQWRERLRESDPERFAQLVAKTNANIKRWAKTDKGRLHVRFKRQKRRALLRSSSHPGVTAAEWESICARHTNTDGKVCCAYCKSECEPTVDHVVPLARGGLHEPSNVVPACGSCNSSKCDHLLSEWPRARELLSDAEMVKLMCEIQCRAA